MKTEMMDERPIATDDELRQTERFAWRTFWAFIILFVITCFLALNSWQQSNNETVLNQEILKLRIQLEARK